MAYRLAVFSYIDDPFDPPGEQKFGGGQAFMFELGRWLVRLGHDVTFVTQLNDSTKLEFETLGPHARIYRVRAGEVKYKAGEEASEDIDTLVSGTLDILGDIDCFEFIHAQYWISGAIALDFLKARGERTPLFYYPLSFGRIKRGRGPHADPHAECRERIEPDVLARADTIVVGTPTERDQLREHYPEVSPNQILLSPLWYDADVFRPRPEPAHDFVRRAARRFAQGA